MLLVVACATVAAAATGYASAAGSGAATATRPPADNDRTLRPLSPDEIPPNLSFYAVDPLYKPGVPLGWADRASRRTARSRRRRARDGRSARPCELAVASGRRERTSRSTSIDRPAAARRRVSTRSRFAGRPTSSTRCPRSMAITHGLSPPSPADANASLRRARRCLQALPPSRTRRSACAKTCAAWIAWGSAI